MEIDGQNADGHADGPDHALSGYFFAQQHKSQKRDERRGRAADEPARRRCGVAQPPEDECTVQNDPEQGLQQKRKMGFAVCFPWTAPLPEGQRQQDQQADEDAQLRGEKDRHRRDHAFSGHYGASRNAHSRCEKKIRLYSLVFHCPARM